MRTPKIELSKIHFEFKQAEKIHTISYVYIGRENWHKSITMRKTYKVYYGFNGTAQLSCGKTQVNPCYSDAYKWLKDSLSYIAAKTP